MSVLSLLVKSCDTSLSLLTQAHIHTCKYKTDTDALAHTYIYPYISTYTLKSVFKTHTLSRAVFALSGTRARLFTFHTIPGPELSQRLQTYPPLLENYKQCTVQVKSPHQISHILAFHHISFPLSFHFARLMPSQSVMSKQVIS